jgi:hypothetical protein
MTSFPDSYESPPAKRSKVEKLRDRILNLVAMHKESDSLEEGECHAAFVMALKGLDARLEEDEIAAWVIPPRTGQYEGPALSA